jgi:hypothetical protein
MTLEEIQEQVRHLKDAGSPPSAEPEAIGNVTFAPVPAATDVEQLVKELKEVHEKTAKLRELAAGA